MTRFQITVETPTLDDPDAEKALTEQIIDRLTTAAGGLDELSIVPQGDLARDAFTVRIERVSITHRWITDSDVIDRLAVGLATKAEWSSDELEWIATLLAQVRPSVGDQDPLEYVKDFKEATGIDPATDSYGLQDYLSDDYEEALEEEAQKRACASCGEVQPTMEDLATYGGEDALLCSDCRYERAVEESISYPHDWSPSGTRCSRTGCNVVGTGDPLNDGNCLMHRANPEHPENANAAEHRYSLLPDPKPHTCWDTPEWDGSMQEGCEGCDQAAAHPCRYCGYGRVFTTHNDLAHAENGDPSIPADTTDTWHNSPHVYETTED